MDEAKTWRLIHEGRSAAADMLAALTPDQWSKPSLCAGWSVQVAAGHIVVGAEQTSAGFVKGMATNLFRFNTMVDRDARRLEPCLPARSSNDCVHGPAPPTAHPRQ